MTWRPISSAPKGGLRPIKIDLWVHEPGKGGYRVTDAFWADNAWKITIKFGLRIRAFAAWHTATHWRRRPKPPEAAS